jgi:hypothetical protein
LEDKVRLTGVKETLIILGALEDDSIKKIKSDIRSVISTSGVVSSIKSRTPAVAPMSGMVHSGPTRWGGVRSVTTAVAPLTLSRLGGKRDIPLVSIVASGGSQGLGFDYAELAGIRRSGPRARSKIRFTSSRGSVKGDGSIRLNGQGDNFIRVLEDRNGKTPGRFAFSAVLEKRRALQLGIQRVLDTYAARINRKLR